VWSWGYWCVLLLRGNRVEPGSAATHLPGLFGPCVAALVVTGLSDGRDGVRRFLARCVRLPAPRVRWLLLACSPLLFGLAVFAVSAVGGGRVPALSEFNSYPGTPGDWPLVAVVALVFVLNGIGEEGGWRGFALPQLMQGRSTLRASLLLTIMWLLWHAPLFVLNTRMADLLGIALLGWALGLTAGSVVLAWLYVRSQSILVVAVWHTAFNFVVATTPGVGLVAAAASTVVMIAGAVIAVGWWRERTRVRR
jgi:uncharacterized protein